MCRLAMFNKQFMEKAGREQLLTFLDQLEKSNGGHGNGFALIDKGRVRFFHKSITLANRQIVNMAFSSEDNLPDWLIYHTRIASAGSKKDDNCHPYINTSRNFLACMNGTVTSFGSMAKILDITDTELMFRNIDAFNIPIDTLLEFSPRWLGLKDGKVFAVNPSNGGLQYYNDEDGCIAIASEKPVGSTAWRALEDDEVWYEGEELNEKVYKTSTYTSTYSGKPRRAYGWTDDEDYNWYYNWYYGEDSKSKNTTKVEQPAPESKEEDITTVSKGEVYTFIEREIDIFDAIDETRLFVGQSGITVEDMEDYLKQLLGSLFIINKHGEKSQIVVSLVGINLLDEEGEVLY